jgi:hypothetical protein
MTDEGWQADDGHHKKRLWWQAAALSVTGICQHEGRRVGGKRRTRLEGPPHANSGVSQRAMYPCPHTHASRAGGPGRRRGCPPPARCGVCCPLLWPLCGDRPTPTRAPAGAGTRCLRGATVGWWLCVCAERWVVGKGGGGVKPLGRTESRGLLPLGGGCVARERGAPSLAKPRESLPRGAAKTRCRRPSIRSILLCSPAYVTAGQEHQRASATPTYTHPLPVLGSGPQTLGHAQRSVRTRSQPSAVWVYGSGCIQPAGWILPSPGTPGANR